MVLISGLIHSKELNRETSSVPCLFPRPTSLHQPREKLCPVSTGGVGGAIYSKTKEDFGVGLKGGRVRGPQGLVWGRCGEGGKELCVQAPNLNQHPQKCPAASEEPPNMSLSESPPA